MTTTTMTVHNLWRTKQQICADLGVSPSTVQRMVRRGEVERQRSKGQRPLYKLTVQVTSQTVKPVTSQGSSQVVMTSQCLSDPTKTVDPVTSQVVTGQMVTDRSDSEVAEPDFIGLVERLTDRVAELERDKAHLEHERDDALTVGHQIADARDELAEEKVRLMALLGQAHEALTRSNIDVKRLHEAIDSVTDAVAMVCASPLAVPVRRRLRAALATC